MIQPFDAPSALARSMNCRSFTDSTWLRTMRDVPAQPSRPMTMISTVTRPQRPARRRGRPSSGGDDDHRRQERQHQEPVVDRGQDAVGPAAEVAGADADDGADDRRDDRGREADRIEICVPRMSCESTSRPLPSVPSQCSDDGGARMSGRERVRGVRVLRRQPAARRSRHHREEDQDAEADDAAGRAQHQAQRRRRRRRARAARPLRRRCAPPRSAPATRGSRSVWPSARPSRADRGTRNICRRAG